MRTAIYATCAALALAFGFASAQAPAPPQAVVQPPAPDSIGSGPYPAIKEVDPTLTNHVVYRPRSLETVREPLGVLVWGNGGCRDDGASARQHLLEIASHGYVAIAPGLIASGPGAPPRNDVPARDAQGRLPPPKTTSADVAAGIDWALAENARKGSPYFGKIDPKLVAVAGHSCGGLQAILVGADPRVATVMVHNSGIFADGSNPISGLTVDKSMLMKLHTPVLYVLGGPGDVAYPNGVDDFRKIDHVPVVLADIGVGHSGTFREPNGGRVGKVSVDWLQWRLRGNQEAARTFVGPDCRLCRDSNWTIERKDPVR